MTLSGFVLKNAFRNRRRSLLTVLSITFSLLLLTLMMTIWRGFYLDQGPPDAGLRLMTRHRVSLAFFLPAFYRQKIRDIPGVTHVVPLTFFGGIYRDDRPENYFAQFATDSGEYMGVAADKQVPPDQLEAWKRDRTGCMVDTELARKHSWKLGDRITLKGNIFPVDLDLTIRAMYTIDPPNNTLYFHNEYLEESVGWYKGSAGFYYIRVDSPGSVSRVARDIDAMFRNSPQPTRSESEQMFRLGFIAMLGNVKAFILSICAAVVFAILLVSANTVAMSIRERTREIALLKTLGFTRRSVLSLFLGESILLALCGGLFGVFGAVALVHGITKSPAGIGIPTAMKVTPPTIFIALTAAVLVGIVSAAIPAYRASMKNIVEGLRHVG